MLERRQFMTAAGAALVALPFARAATAAPLSIDNAGLVFTPITVNGRAGTAMVDSGSVRGLQLSDMFAAALKLKLEDTGGRTQRYQGSGKQILAAQVDTLAFGGTTLSHIEASVSPGDIESIAGQIGQPFDAILGWPVLSRQGLAIDYHTNELAVGNEAGRGVALQLVDKPLPVVAGTLAGKPTNFLIDTGAPGCRIDISQAEGATQGSREDLDFVIAGKSFSASFQVKDLSAMSRGLGATAVIGHRFLQNFKLVWVPATRSIWLAPLLRD